MNVRLGFTFLSSAAIEQIIADEWPETLVDPRIGQTVKVELTLAICETGQEGEPVDHPRGESARRFTPGDRFVVVTPIAVKVVDQ